jgi:hypothetical protein
MGDAALADPAVDVAGHLARIEVLVATGQRALAAQLERALKDGAALRAEVGDLRRQLADGRAREWLSINACARRFDVSRAEIQRRIAAGELRVRPRRVAGHDTHQIHLDSARVAFGGA